MRIGCCDTSARGRRWSEPTPAWPRWSSRDELYRALATLNEDEREALALRFGADLKLRDVAKLLGDGESAVEGRIYRALRKLRGELD